ncbi:helicase swr-1 [Diplogelasinospora grovesii]|uniref:DNA helicase n=1 Tax=Diplogelasinospora grovesii TaxID=303347 RepID=A0AAN6NBV4_9PEZI|nr:helicase swr-1 [Diplogelasinospora grovesii]
MTETASPEPTHANSAANKGENGHHNEQTPASDCEFADTVKTEDEKLLEEDSQEIRGRQKAEDDQNSTGDSALVNGSTRESDNADDGPPAKRRRVVRDTTPNNSIRKPKLESPPWKKIQAEGPSSFTEGGRRKSGRINTVPLELQRGDKRITRRSLHSQQASPPKNKYASTNGHSSALHSTSSPTAASKRPTSSGKHMPSKIIPSKAPPPTKVQAAKAQVRKPATPDTRSSARTRRRSPSPNRPTTPPRPAVGTRRSARHARESFGDAAEGTSPAGVRTTPRIKIRARPPLTVLPLVHRDQANIRTKLAPSFEEYFDRALHIPVEEGGMLTADDGPRYTDDMARSDAQVILRIEQEAEPGGLLAGNKCSVFEPEPEEEPPRQWAHMDHLTKAATNFRKLMLVEQQRHRATAKRLAIACEAEWRRRNPQPKTAEEIELEERERAIAGWRLVTRAIMGTWDNVKAEINRRRLIEWEAEEQRRVKAALNQAVNLSEQKLQARQARLDTDDISDDNEEDEDEDDIDEMATDMDDDDVDSEADGGSLNEKGEDESNMSSSDDDEDKDSVLSDEGLTQEQLRAKYANLPDLGDSEAPEGAKKPQVDEEDDASGALDDDDTSDESIDMDDDLGSTEDESDGEEDDDDDDDKGGNDGSDGDAEDSEDEPAGLLGLFFKKSELKKLKEEEVKEADVDMADAVDAPVDGKPYINGIEREAAAIGQDHPSGPKGDIEGETTPGTLATAPTEKQPVEDNVLRASPTRTSRKGQDAVESREDISMVDASAATELSHPETPEIEITDAPANPLNHSPETDAVTNLQSPSRSQSPPTSDTKPSDIETASSVSGLNAAKHDDSRLASPQPTGPKTEIPFLLRGTLREYQHYGLEWLANLYANNTNGILADEMGLGKTIQTIALLAHLACHHEVWGPHLVIVPTSVMLNWEMEFKKWCPGFKILTYYGNQEERKRKRQGWTNDDVWNVCITSYQMVLQDQQVFRRRRWHYMILDEAHNIKNFRSQRWQTLLGFNTHSRLLLTGTPLQNNLTELWSLLYFLAPPENGEGGFADLQEFHNWFSRPESQILESGREHLDDEARAIISKLHKVLRPYLLRRLKADVEKQMPAKHEHVEFCRLSKRQRELYDGFLSRNETRETLASGNYMSIINCLMQLRKVCNHPDLFVDRPIMTSLRMQRSVAADFEVQENMIRNQLLAEKPMSVVSLKFLNMIPTAYEDMSNIHADRIAQLSAPRTLLDLRETQKARANNAYTPLDPVTVKSNLVYLESAARWGRFEELQHRVYLDALRRQQRPIYGKRLLDFLTLGTESRPHKQRPKIPHKIMSWFEEDSFLLRNAIPTLQQRAASMEMTVTKFACVTPAVVTGDLSKYLLGQRGIEAFEEANLRLAAPVKHAPYMPKESPPDPWHEARMRLTIQFPDKRLLQYDCGKLQALDKLLRKLQAGGHRALIFTQMTKVLDILEQFLNIHGHKYLRLDGATKVEQRQILTDRFNHDPRILCFILSTRSGGLGINLTGADTVIFYDQDWNPAMDKQCQDRCHRIGQTRDVHIYRLVSEHTIEANILRKASQKQMLDDVVIQEGEFTTDYFNKLSVRDVIGNNGEVIAENEDDVAANLAMDRVLGGVNEKETPRNVGRVLEQAEDKEDVAAARVAEKEIQQDDADFEVDQAKSGVSSAAAPTPREGTTDPLAVPDEVAAATEELAEVEYNAFGAKMHNIDDYMLKFMATALEGTPLELPKDKKKSKKKGKDMRKR